MTIVARKRWGKEHFRRRRKKKLTFILSSRPVLFIPVHKNRRRHETFSTPRSTKAASGRVPHLNALPGVGEGEVDRLHHRSLLSIGGDARHWTTTGRRYAESIAQRGAVGVSASALRLERNNSCTRTRDEHEEDITRRRRRNRGSACQDDVVVSRLRHPLRSRTSPSHARRSSR